MYDINQMFAGAKERSGGLNFPKQGRHKCAFVGFCNYAKVNEPPKYRADFLVIQSEVHGPGEIINIVYQPYSQKYQGAGAQEAGEIQKMLRALHGAPAGTPPDQMGQLFTQTLDPSQPARGMLIDVTSQDRVTSKGAEVSNQDYFHVPGQTAEAVAAGRAKVEGAPTYQEFAAKSANAAAQAQAPQQWAQPQQAQAPQQPQQMPGVPAQGFGPQAPQQVPQAAPAQPQGNPMQPPPPSGGGSFPW